MMLARKLTQLGDGAPVPIMGEPSEPDTVAESRSPTSRRLFFDRMTKTVFVVYMVVLTALLLTRDPLAKDPTGALEALLSLIGPVAHLLSFWLLAALALGSRWPVRGWVLVLLLAGYATGTELLQGAVSGRTPEWMDWFQDLLGVAIGAGSLAAVSFGTRRYRDGTG